METTIEQFKMGSQMLEMADLGQVILIDLIKYPNISKLYNRLYSGLRCCGLDQDLSGKVINRFHEQSGYGLFDGNDITEEELTTYFDEVSAKMVVYLKEVARIKQE